MDDKTRETDLAFSSRIKAEAMFGDNECDHAKADDILCELLMELGYEQTVAAFEEVGKWYA